MSVEKTLKVLSLLAIVNGECCLSRHQRYPILTIQHDFTAHRARGRIVTQHPPESGINVECAALKSTRESLGGA